MTVSQAFNIFNLSPNVSKDIMVKRYHELIKNFHPDTAGDTITGNNDAKILNQAYSLLLEYFTHYYERNNTQSEIDNHKHQAYRNDATDNSSNNTTGNINNTSSDLLVVPKSLTAQIQRMCGFICDYYTMNLANIPLRTAGSTRTFFSTFMHKYKKAMVMLSANHEELRSIQQLFVFYNCFYENAHLNFFLQPTKSRTINRMNRAYVQSSLIIDRAIAVRYCENHKPREFSQSVTTSQLEDVYEIFQLLSTSSESLIFNEPARIKLMLVDSFTKSIHWKYKEQHNVSP